MNTGRDWRIRYIEKTWFAVHTNFHRQIVKDFTTLESATQWLEEEDKKDGRTFSRASNSYSE
jgi:hypothetical protein